MATSIAAILFLFCVLEEVRTYDTVQWTEVKQGGNVPLARQQFAGTRAPKGNMDCFFIFGGLNNWDSPDGLLNDLRCFDIATTTWVDLKQSGTAPSARRRHTLVAAGDFLVVFGGIDGSHAPVNSLGKYNIATDQWVSVNPSGSIPSVRGGHTAVALGTRMIVFGGQGKSSFLNDVYSYDAKNDQWSLVKSSGQLPGGRALMSAVTVGTDMYIFGGLEGYGGYKYYLDQLYKFNTVTSQWTQILIGGAPAARAHHSSVVENNNRVTIIGGYSTTLLSDVFFYDIKANEWLMVEPVSDVPLAREAFAAIPLSENNVMLFGGYDGYWPGTREEMYILTFGSTANKTVV